MDAKHTGKIYGINGPVIYLKGRTGFKMSEMVYVGEERLVGEVISLDKDRTTIQVYEETSGLKPGEIVEGTGDAVSVILAPGIINNIFDGIERPLEKIAQASNGAFITRGVSVDSLDLDKLWDTHMTVAEGDALQGGAIIAEVPETHAIVHKCMVPPDVEGIVVSVVPDGQYHINDTLVVIETRTLHDAEMADPCAKAGASPLFCKSSACDGTACHGYYVPSGERRNSRNSGRIRNRKDDEPASDRKMVRCGHYCIYRMRRARK